MHAVLTVFYALIFAWLFYRLRWFRLGSLPAWTVPVLFLIKIGAGILLWLIYTYHYTYRDTSDAFRYFDDAMVIRSLWTEDRELFWRFMFGSGLHLEDTKPVLDQLKTWSVGYSYGLNYDGPTIVRLNVLISFFSWGHYHVHTIFMSMFSTIGLTAIVHSFSHFFRGRMLWLAAMVFLIPSVCFWSSGVLKEAPLMMGCGLMVWSLFRLPVLYGKIYIWIVFLASTALLVHLKEYVIISMIPASVFFIISSLTSQRMVWINFVVVHLVLILAALKLPLISGGNLVYVLQKKQQDFVNVGEMAGAGSMISPIEISDVGSFLLHYPEALFTAYFRPFLFESSNPFYILAALENVLLAALIVMMFVRFRRPAREELKMLLWCLSFVLVLGGIIGFTVPILGALVRYKIAAIPFLFITISAMIRPFRTESV